MNYQDQMIKLQKQAVEIARMKLAAEEAKLARLRENRDNERWSTMSATQRRSTAAKEAWRRWKEGGNVGYIGSIQPNSGFNHDEYMDSRKKAYLDSLSN